MIVSKHYTRRDPALFSLENCDPNPQQSVSPRPNTGNDSKADDDEDDIEYLRKFFVMPDFHRIMKGYVKEEGEAFAPDEQVLTMESERFTVPEVLFRPTDVGMNQAGIIEAVGQSLNCLHEVSQLNLLHSHSWLARSRFMREKCYFDWWQCVSSELQDKNSFRYSTIYTPSMGRRSSSLSSK